MGGSEDTYMTPIRLLRPLRLTPPLVHVHITTRRTKPFDWALSGDPYLCNPKEQTT